MSLLGKVRTLIGALVRAPFMPATEKTDRETASAPPAAGGPGRDRASLERQQQEPMDDSRVADLIARRRDGGEP